MLLVPRGSALPTTFSLLLELSCLVYLLYPCANATASTEDLLHNDNRSLRPSLAPSIAPDARSPEVPFSSLESTAASSSTHFSRENGSQDTLVLVETAADVSIDQVEDHLHLVEQLERSVDKSVRELGCTDERLTYTRFQLQEREHVRDDLVLVQSDLKRLARGLNRTLLELERVEQEEALQSKKLQDVLAVQEEEERKQQLEKEGIQDMDYETGHLKHTTGLNTEQLKKLEAVEKMADPAVLHYDMELLAQIAVLLGGSAVGGIVATYFNVPPHAGYLLGGALVGPSCLGFVRRYKEVETISLFGSVFLLFGHGAAYSPQEPEDVFRKYFVGGVAYIVSTVLLVAGGAVHIGWTDSFIEGLIIGLGVCFSTTAPLYEHIRENGIQDSSFGRVCTVARAKVIWFSADESFVLFDRQ
uniref:Cation/H+ exchanger transmembrane domain-containing protein n=2 Tax=Hyaloperonospora arabidopsidis (strain Emoy2) TaxID=559515 RepID=M4B595_HYAAE